MLNELEEYLRILSCLLAGKKPLPMHPMHHHLLWLPDAAGHAEGLRINTDSVEKKIIEKQHKFKETFNAFYIKAVELTGYLRTNLQQFPALSRFNRDVELEIILFQAFLKELVDMGLTKELLGTFAPLLADHMYREECYYLHKLAQVSEVTMPNCSPFSNL
jgi:hypothetical protein